MEPTATCEIKVLDDQGHPLANAEVYFWPNVIWNGNGSTIFMGPTFKSEDLLRSGEDFNWQKFRKENPPAYFAKSDQRGIAIVPNLPAFNQSFQVEHTNYEMSITPLNNRREASSKLLPGETNYVTVIMEKKGTEFLQSPR